MALPVFALTALLSKKATERLAKEQGEPSDIEAGFYWLHMVSKWGAIALLPYLFIVGLVWIAMNDNASRIFNQAFTVIFDQALSDLENNREYKALKTLDNKLWFLRDPYLPFFPALVALAFFAIVKLFFNL